MYVLLQVILQGIELVTFKHISHAQWPKEGIKQRKKEWTKTKLLHMLSNFSTIFRITIYPMISTKGFILCTGI